MNHDRLNHLNGALMALSLGLLGFDLGEFGLQDDGPNEIGYGGGIGLFAKCFGGDLKAIWNHSVQMEVIDTVLTATKQW